MVKIDETNPTVMAKILIASSMPKGVTDVKAALGSNYEYIEIGSMEDLDSALKEDKDLGDVIILHASISRWQEKLTWKMLDSMSTQQRSRAIAWSRNTFFRDEVKDRGLFAEIDEDPGLLHRTVEQFLVAKMEVPSLH